MSNESDKSERQSLRLREYDYSQDGAYFVTICTKAKFSYFDIYPELKIIVQAEWESLPERFPTIVNDAFIVMPNHIHAVIILVKQDTVGATLEVAHRAGSSPAPTVGQIIGAFKSLCVNKWAKHLMLNRQNLKESIWQRNYYEHVIRSEEELNLIREYIIFNPLKWSLDSYNPDHICDQEYVKKWQWLEIMTISDP